MSSYYTNEQKKEIFRKWIEQGRPWFDIDKSKEPSWEERKIILEIKKQENDKVKRELELEKRTKDIRERYEKKGVISDKIFDLDNY
jgi:hypothetical protein